VDQFNELTSLDVPKYSSNTLMSWYLFIMSWIILKWLFILKWPIGLYWFNVLVVYFLLTSVIVCFEMIALEFFHGN